jgi:hypothetical protein
VAYRLLASDLESTEVGMTDRDKYRDNDDMRDPAEDRAGTDPDTKAEARGDAREATGNTRRETAADPTGPDGNDKTRHRPRPDIYDGDLARDNRAQSDRRDDEITES